jgi:PAS domain S-box-containing protein
MSSLKSSLPVSAENTSTRAVEALRWLERLFYDSPVAIGFARDGVMLDGNPAYFRLFRCQSVEELQGRSILEQIAPSHRGEVSERLARRVEGEGPPWRYQTRGLRKDGTEFPVEITSTRVVVSDGPLSIAFLTDISEREDALKALHASEERFRTLAEAGLDGVFVHQNGAFILTNEVGAAMFGYDSASIIGKRLMEVTAPGSRALVAENLAKPGSVYEIEGLRRDGTTFFCEVRGKTLTVDGATTRVSVVRDVTERKLCEAEQRALAERIRHAQKLESLGVLAGGVAHDFSNILTVISNGVAVAKLESGLSAQCTSQLEAIALAAERAADLCRQMLMYAGKARIEREVVDLSALVEDMSGILEASISKKASFERKLASGLPTLHADATQIRQVLMNLVLNASEAISTPQGRIRVSTGAGIFDAAAFAESVAGGNPEAGPYVWLEVDDDGVGMDAHTRAQMFDPFFSTKFVGRGLGMAAVLGIVRSHEGALFVDSSPGVGTRIRVLLPAGAAGQKTASPKPAEQLRGQGVVLLVEDDKNVRMTTTLLLQGFGFEVICANDGVECVKAFQSNASRINAVLLDYSMPRMDGVETLKELRRIAPETPVVLMSGYGSSMSLPGGPNSRGPDAVLAKPYTPELLFATVLRVMSKPG